MARIAVIPGDGIGPEVMAEGLKVLKAVGEAEGLAFDTVTFDYGAERYLKDGTTLPDEGLAELRDEFDAILLGALGRPADPRHAPRPGDPPAPALRPRPVHQPAAGAPPRRRASAP